MTECYFLQMINWLDLGANTVPPLVANAVTERWYMQVRLAAATLRPNFSLECWLLVVGIAWARGAGCEFAGHSKPCLRRQGA